MKKSLGLVLGLVFSVVVGYAQDVYYFDNSRDVVVGDSRGVISTSCPNTAPCLAWGSDSDPYSCAVSCEVIYSLTPIIRTPQPGIMKIDMVRKRFTYRKSGYVANAPSSVTVNLPSDYREDKYPVSTRGQLEYHPVNYSLSANEIGICPGEAVTLSNYLTDDQGGGTTWSGEHVTGGIFGQSEPKPEPGTYTVTATRTFVNGVSTLTLKIIVFGVEVSGGDDMKLCRLDSLYKISTNYLHGRGESPKNGASVAHGGKVINVYFFPEAEINEGQYVDVTKPVGSYTVSYDVHVEYSNYENKRCFFRAPKTVKIISPPVHRTAGDDLEVCHGTTSPLELSQGATLNAEYFTWKVKGLGEDKITQTANKATADVRKLDVGDHKVTLEYYNSNCFSVHTKTLKVNETPSALTFPGSSLCGSQRVALSEGRVSSGLEVGNTVVWYDAQEGDNEIGRQGGSLEVGTTRVLWGAQETPQGCLSPRVSDRVNVFDVPVVEPFSFSRCGKGEINVNLNEDNRFDGWKVGWYDLTGGEEPLGSTFTYKAHFEDLSTTRFIELTDLNGCSPAKRVKVDFHVLPRPDMPNVENSGVCGLGKVRFEAPGGLTALDRYVWYELKEASNSIDEGQVFTTDLLREDKFYYVALKTSENNGGCESDRQKVTASVWPVPPALTFPGTSLCGSGTVELSSDRIDGELPIDHTVVWYDASEEGKELGKLGDELQVEQSIAFWGAQQSDKGCFSERVKDTVTVHAVPEIPVLEEVVECGVPSENIRFSVDLNVNHRFDGWKAEWYEDNLGGELLTSEFVYNNEFNKRSTLRYVAFTDPNGCSPVERSEVLFRISDKPNEPIIVDSGVCGGGVVVFDTPALTSGEYVWYPDMVAGVELDDADEDGNTFTTEELTNTRKYYVTVKIASETSSCESDRKEVTASVWPVPAGLSPQTVSRCGPGTVGFENVVLGMEGSEVAWYTAEDDETSFHTGPMFTTPELEITTNYFIRERSSYGCLSVPTTVTAEIKPITAINLGEDFSLCKDASPLILDDLLPSNISADQGSFIGTGVSVSDDKTYFYPNIAGVGIHEIKFNLNEENKSIYDQFCLTPGEKVFTVTEIGDVDATGLEIASQKEEIYFGEWNRFSVVNPEELGIASYEWDLGFGITSSDSEPFYYYYNAGLVDVGVRVQFESGCSYAMEAKGILNVLGVKDEDEVKPPDVTTAVQQDKLSEPSVKVWPNPTTDVLRLRLSENIKTISYSLYDGTMRAVQEGTLKNTYTGEVSINTNTLISGAYYLKLNNKIFRLIKK